MWDDSSRHAQVLERLRWFEFVTHAVDANLPISNEKTFVSFIHSKMMVYQFLTGSKKSLKIDRVRNFSTMFSVLDQENISEGLLPLRLIVFVVFDDSRQVKILRVLSFSLKPGVYGTSVGDLS